MKMHKKHVFLRAMYYMTRPNGKKSILCKLCDQTCLTIFELSLHIKQTHLNLLMLGASPSPVSYSITNELGCELNIDDSETDMQEQYDVTRYTCEICGSQFNRRFKLMKHQQKDHYYDHIPFSCDKCSFKSISKSVLFYHTRTQCRNTLKRFYCKKCPTRFMWKVNLKNHEKLIHGGLHTCTICKTDFATNYDLKNHSVCEPNEEISKYECAECGLKFKRKDPLVRHLKSHHQKKSQNPDLHLCPHCGKKLSSAGNLAVHIIRHTGEKPFECDVCKKCFARLADLKMHQLTHSKERAYNCAICDKAFSRSYQVKTHMRVHTGEKPYKCTYCKRGFAQCNDLKVHIRRHTGDKPYPCKKCGETFVEGKALKKHQKLRGH